MSQPLTRFTNGKIQVSVWENEGKKGTYHSVRINKRYQDPKTGEWKDSTSYFPSEIVALQDLLKQTAEFVEKQEGAGVGGTPLGGASGGGGQTAGGSARRRDPHRN